MAKEKFDRPKNRARYLAIRCCSFVAATLAAAPALAQTTISPIAMGRIARNTTLSVTVKPVPVTPVSVGFAAHEPGGVSPTCESTFAARIPTQATDTGVAFTVPSTLPAKQYLMCLLVDGTSFPVPTGSTPFEVINAGRPTIDDLPVVAYPRGGAYQLSMHGSNFSPVPDENYLLINGRKVPPHCGTAECTTRYLRFAVERKPGTGEPHEPIAGIVPLRLYVTGGETSDSREVTFAAISADEAKFFAIAATLVLIAIVVALVFRGLRAAGGPPTRRGVIAALLLDTDGQSYSLAKFQFLVWTVAAVGGYLFLAFSWSLVQWQLDLPPVPEGLPGIVGISGVTAITAVAASEARGPKGSGRAPSVGDYVMTGGRVAAERLQFFAWTLVSVLAFVVAVGMADPGVIETLPEIPEGLLFLMGISAAGYLGGKFIRRAGPTLTTIPAKFETGELVLTPEGRYLSDRLRILIDGTHVLGMGDSHPSNIPVVEVTGADADAELSDPGFFKKLTLRISNPPKEWQVGKHDLRVVNPDGQTTAKGFEVNKVPVLFA